VCPVTSGFAVRTKNHPLADTKGYASGFAESNQHVIIPFVTWMSHPRVRKPFNSEQLSGWVMLGGPELYKRWEGAGI
jgi:hypothetical protein